MSEQGTAAASRGRVPLRLPTAPAERHLAVWREGVKDLQRCAILVLERHEICRCLRIGGPSVFLARVCLELCEQRYVEPAGRRTAEDLGELRHVAEKLGRKGIRAPTRGAVRRGQPRRVCFA